MITIEILVSMVILFFVVSTSVMVLKQLRQNLNQQHKHERYFIEVQNIKDSLMPTLCRQTLETEGELDGFSYVATCKKLIEKRSFDKYENGGSNTGNYLVQLFKVTLQLRKNSLEKNYHFYLSVSQWL